MLERRVATAHKLALSGLLATVAVSTFVVTSLGVLLQGPVKEAALVARSFEQPVVMWRLNAPSFSVYFGEPTASREPRRGDVVVTKKKWLAQLPAGLRYQVLYSRRGIVLVKIGT